MEDKKIVLLIDAENTSAKYADCIMHYLEKQGIIISARIYGDFINNNNVKGWNPKAIQYEMEQKQQLTTSAGKNASDIALVIDAMDLLYLKTIDTFCIVTSDGDFTNLVKRIREDGIEVIGIGKTDASKRLGKVCDLYLDFEDLMEKPKDNTEKESAKNRKNEYKEKAERGTGKNKRAEDKIESDTSKGKKIEDGEGESIAKNKKAENKAEKGASKNKKAEDKAEKDTAKNKKTEEKGASKNKKTEDRMESGSEKGKKPSGKGDEEPAQTTEAERTEKRVEPLNHIKMALNELVQQDENAGKYADLGGIKSRIQLRYPGFDERDYGYKTIWELIDNETKFEVYQEGKHTYVRSSKKNRETDVTEDTKLEDVCRFLLNSFPEKVIGLHELAAFGKKLQSAFPDFQYKDYGYGKLSAFLEELGFRIY